MTLPQLKGQPGDDQWDEIVRRHQRRVLVSVLALGVPWDAAEDVVAETWIRLLARRRAGELPRFEMPGLAVAQARFIALDALRKQGRALAPAARDVEPHPNSSTTLGEREDRRVVISLSIKTVEADRRVVISRSIKTGEAGGTAGLFA